MSTIYEIWLARDDGTRLKVLDTVASFEYTLAVNTYGHFVVNLPFGFDKNLLRYDHRIYFWRKPEGGAMSLDFEGLIRIPSEWADERQKLFRAIEGYSLEYLIEGRLIAASTASTAANKVDNADDLLKAFVRDHLGANAVAARQISSTYFSVASDLALGPTIYRGASYEFLLDTLRGICDSSRGAGTELFFRIAPTTDSSNEVKSFEFRTYTGQPGADRTSDVANGLIFGMEYGNLRNPKLVQDATEEANVMYALGQGLEDIRLVQTAEDTARSGRSIFGRREGKVEANNEPDPNAVQDLADAELVNRRPKDHFTGDLVSTERTLYGRDWKHGDKVTVTFAGRQFDALVQAVTVAVDGNGNEFIQTQAEAYL